MENGKSTTINITTGTFIRGGFFILLLVFFYLIRDIVASILLAIVIASGVEPAANWLQRKLKNRVLSVVLVYLMFFLVLGMFFYLIVPPVFEEISNLASGVPKLMDESFQTKILRDFIPSLPDSISQFLLALAENLQSVFEKFTTGFFHATSALFGGALSFFLVFVLSFYLSVQDKGIENFLKIVIPIKYENYAVNLWLRTREKIGSWLKGQLLLGLLIGVMVFLGLTILRIKYALVFAVLAGVFELIPIFGPILASLPAIGAAFLQSPTLALVVIILYFVIQQFENHLIYPVVVHKVVGISPVVAILALIIGGKIAGFAGLILAIPISTVVVEMLNDMEKRKRVA